MLGMSQTDTVDAVHPDYRHMLPAWETAQDVAFGGARAVKAAGQRYLPMLAWREDAHEKYAAYLQRAVFPNAVLRTRVAVEGQVFRVSPRVTIPAAIMAPADADAMLASFAKDGASFEIYARRMFAQVFGMGRAIGVVDITEANDTRALLYGALGMTNWWTADRDGRDAGVQVLFAETLLQPTGRYLRTAIPVRREYLWVEGDPPPAYTRPRHASGYVVVVEHRYLTQGMKSEWVASLPMIPNWRGLTMPDFPVTVVNPYDLGYATTEPPLSEMIDVNLSLYRTSADLEHGRHFAGVPAPYVFGVKKGTTVELGSSTFLTSENANAKAGFIEFSAQGLRALETAVQEKTTQLVEAGARLFARQTGSPATYEAGRLAATADWSIVESVARTVSIGLEYVLAQMIAFRDPNGATTEEIRDQVSVALNTDYEPLPLTATDALRWTEAYLQGGISRETMWEIFQRGGAFPPGWSLVDEMASITTDEATRAQTLAVRGPQGNRPGRLPGRTPAADRRTAGTRDTTGESQGSPSRSDGQP
jgi:hypothetical protein